jgi:uncharacterized protein with PIN domain
MASGKEKSNDDTPTVYSHEEAKQIRKLVRTSKEPPRCPRCDEALKIGPEALHQVGGKEYTVRALSCPVCRRLVSIKNMPKRR